jgi:lipid-binding SYLF domain-containing protein
MNYGWFIQTDVDRTKATSRGLCGLAIQGNEDLAMTRLMTLATAAMAALLCTTALAASKPERKVDDSIAVIQKFTNIPESAIPDSLLRDAYGVAVIPGVIKVGFMLGGRFGKGVLMTRQDDGNWSNPAFVSIGGGSFGWQIGAQSTDIILVFKDRRSIDNIFNGKMTLGGDASVAAGPVGRQTSASTDGRLQAEIYTYARNRGLFAGVSLEGSWLSMDRNANEAYYGNGMSPQQILAADNLAAPLNARQLVEILEGAAPAINSRPTQIRTAAAVVPAEVTPLGQDSGVQDSGTQTYTIEPLGMSGDETSF